ncbi:MAG TPA: hypothetical protein VGQ83_34760 [Polyangia bacterium]|jgi:hypothetical protein
MRSRPVSLTPAGRHLARLLLVPALCASLVTGCYANTVVTSDLAGLRQGNRTRELVLQTSAGDRTRIGPNSEVRFLRTDGQWTAWVQANELCVSGDAVALCQAPAGRPARLRWRYVQGVEVKNLDGAATYGAVLGTTVLVAAVVVLVALSAKGGGGGGGNLLSGMGHGAKAGGHAVRAGGHAGAHALGTAARVTANLTYHVLEATARGWAWYGPELQVVEVAPAPYYPSGLIAASPVAAPPPVVEGAPLPPVATGGRDRAPLFSPEARRRGAVRFVGAVEGGTDFSLGAGGTAAALAGIRVFDALELAGGVRLIAIPDEPGVSGSPVRSRWLAFGRLLAHCDLDSERRVALPIGLDVGGGQAELHLRAVLGLRLRFWEGVSLGVYPYNPTFTSFADGRGERRSAGWFTFPTTTELSFTF